MLNWSIGLPIRREAGHILSMRRHLQLAFRVSAVFNEGRFTWHVLTSQGSISSVSQFWLTYQCFYKPSFFCFLQSEIVKCSQICIQLCWSLLVKVRTFLSHSVLLCSIQLHVSHWFSCVDKNALCHRIQSSVPWRKQNINDSACYPAGSGV